MMPTFKKYIVGLVILSGILVCQEAEAQKASTSSPYSRYGIGQVKREVLPQHLGIGGLSTGVRYLGAYDNINSNNPASYSALTMTTMDAGVFGNITELGNQGKNETSYNFALTHVKFAFPLGRAGGLSFGLLPYSEVGYNYSEMDKVDTTNINRVYAGEGGTSSAYLGYGVRIGKNFSVGANARYLFGTISHIRSIEYPNEVGALNGREDRDRYISGFSADYGVQYYQPIKEQTYLVIGYSGTASTKLKSRSDYLAIRTPTSVSGGTDNLPLDTIRFDEGVNENVTLPFRHSLGITLNKSSNWMVGADFFYETWDQFAIGTAHGGLENSYGVAVGGQFSPDPTSVKYRNLMDYRVGFRYDKSHVAINNQPVNDMAVSVGLGFPLPSLFGSSFYKLNFAAEFGQRGKIAPSFVRERYVNLSLGFTLNDRWFRRPSYD